MDAPALDRSAWRWAWDPLALFAVSRAGHLLVVGISLYLDPRLHRGRGPTRSPTWQ